MGIYALARAVVRMALILAFGLRVRGWRHIPRSGGVLVAANHASYLDPVVLGSAARRPLAQMARDGLFAFAPFGWLLRHLQAFPVRRGQGDLAAVRAALERLRAGAAVVVFPEGTRSRDGRLGPLRPGVALLAARAGVPVVPAWIAGTRRALPRGAWRPRRTSLRVRFGAPLRFDTAVDDSRSFTARLRAALEALRDGRPAPGGPGSGLDSGDPFPRRGACESTLS